LSDIKVGDVVTATVREIVPFGMFVSFDDGALGIIDVLHLSPDGGRIDWDALPQPGERLEVSVFYYQPNGIFKVSRLESLKEMGARREMIERWEAYRSSISLGTEYDGWFGFSRDGAIVSMQAPFDACLVGARMDVDDPANWRRRLRCRVVGFDDRVQRVLVEEAER
jgi:hypothetical protein